MVSEAPNCSYSVKRMVELILYRWNYSALKSIILQQHASTSSRVFCHTHRGTEGAERLASTTTAVLHVYPTRNGRHWQDPTCISVLSKGERNRLYGRIMDQCYITFHGHPELSFHLAAYISRR